MSEASRAIQSLHDFLLQLDVIHNHVIAEAEMVGSQWTQLGRIGGRREDHAALLLGKLISPMTEMRDFINSCISRIESIKADPFKKD